MTPANIVALLGGLVCTIISAVIGHYLGARNKVTEASCKERRGSTNELMEEKITHLIRTIEKLDEKIEKYFEHCTRN